MDFCRLSILIFLSFVLISCSAEHDGSKDSASTGIILNPNPDPALQAAAQDVFSNSCVSCHNGTQVPDLRSSALDVLKTSFYINIGQSDISSLYTRMISSSAPMPPAGLLTQTESDKVKAWIDDLGITPDDEEAAVSAKFSDIEANILTPKCYGCHDGHAIYDFGPGGGTSGYNDLIFSFVAPFNLGSTLYTSVTGGSSGGGNIMPKNQAPLSTIDIESIRSWIMEGALEN